MNIGFQLINKVTRCKVKANKEVICIVVYRSNVEVGCCKTYISKGLLSDMTAYIQLSQLYGNSCFFLIHNAYIQKVVYLGKI